MHRKQLEGTIREVTKAFPRVTVSFQKQKAVFNMPPTPDDMGRELNRKLIELGCVPLFTEGNQRTYQMPKPLANVS